MIRIEQKAYSIGFDPPSQIMTIVLRGYWGADDQIAYERQLRHAIAALPAEGCRPGEQMMLVDITEHAVQSASALEFFRRITSDPIIAGRRRVLVVASALVRLQARRAAPNFEIVTDRRAGVAWLGSREAFAAGSGSPVRR